MVLDSLFSLFAILDEQEISFTEPVFFRRDDNGKSCKRQEMQQTGDKPTNYSYTKLQSSQNWKCFLLTKCVNLHCDTS